jgi:transcriptional regulator with XRE-family HTH domain
VQKSTSPKVKITSEKDRIIWDNLAYLVKKHGWETDAEIARAIGMKPQQFGAIKKAKRGIGAKSIKRICEKLGVTEEWLLNKNDQEGDETEQDMTDIAQHWKTIAENWERQYNELRLQYDELKENPLKAGDLKNH